MRLILISRPKETLRIPHQQIILVPLMILLTNVGTLNIKLLSKRCKIHVSKNGWQFYVHYFFCRSWDHGPTYEFHLNCGFRLKKPVSIFVLKLKEKVWFELKC